MANIAPGSSYVTQLVRPESHGFEEGSLSHAARTAALGARSARAARRCRLTQIDLSRLAGCGPDFVYDVEAGKTSLRLDKLLDVLGVLGLELVVDQGKSGLRVAAALEPARRPMKRSAKPDTAVVLRGAAVAGHLHRTSHGAVFEYEPSLRDAAHPPWDRGIAYRLPYETARVETLGTNLHPFFAGLLPEGLRLEALVRRVKTSRDDLLSLLVDAGADCIGDISVLRDAESPREVTPAVDTAALIDASVCRHPRREPRRQAWPGADPSRRPGEGLRGDDSRFPFARRRGSGAYILKLNPPKMPRLVENEHFFLQMARASGLEVARADLVHDCDGAAGLLVERFDRMAAKGGGVTKVHQEDACQFLDRYPGDKYVLSYADIARGISELGSAPDRGGRQVPPSGRVLVSRGKR